MTSWLEQQRARGTLRPYPVSALARAVGLDPVDPELTGRLALRLSLNRRSVARYRALGLTADQADEWAVRAGFNPGEVWDHWWTNLRGMALVNAGKEMCRDGHPLDRLDAAGFRRCGPCPRAAVKRYRERKSQARTLIVPAASHRASLVVLDGVVKREKLITYLPPDVSQRVGGLASAAGLSKSAWVCALVTAALNGPGESGNPISVTTVSTGFVAPTQEAS